MTATETCPSCGKPLPYDAPEGRCPDCLFGLLDEAPETVPLPTEAGGETLGDTRFFGDYELLEMIARGGMGVVYKARQGSLDRIVALKMILGGQFAPKELIQRFRGEAGAAAALHHPNIVAIHDVGVHGGQHYFTMDYVQGQNLAQLVGNRPFAAKKAAGYVKQIAEAIHYAHQQGILHRDIKPSNVLVDSGTDQPRVTDFGLARRIEGGSSLTMSGQLLGSPNFMPPEQASAARGKPGRHSDVYALGGILFYLLTARPPFQGETLEATIHDVLDNEAISPRLLNPAVHRDLETICLKCLEKEPAKRYPSAETVAEELDRFLADKPIHARPVNRIESAWRWCRRNPALASASCLVLILISIVLIGSPIAAYRINKEKVRAEAETGRAEAEVSRRLMQLYAHEVNLAQESLRDFNLGNARTLLDRQLPVAGKSDLRGFEWRYFMEQCRSDELLTLGRFGRPLTAVCFAPNGQWLAASDGIGGVRVWDYPAQKEIALFPIDANTNVTRFTEVANRRALAISPNSKTLAVGAETSIVLWDLDTRQQIAVLQDHSDIVTVLTFSADGQILVSGSRDKTVRLWNIDTKAPASLAILRVPFGVGSLALAHDRSLLAVGAEEALVRLWDISSLAAPRELSPLKGQTCWAFTLAFSPHSHLLASGGASEITLWNLGPRGEATSRRMLRDHRQSLGIIESLAFAPDGQTLVSAGSDQNLTLWDLSERARDPAKFKANGGDVCAVAFSPNGHRIASGTRDGVLKLWDVDSAWPAAHPMSHGDWLYAVAFSPDSRLLASTAQSADLNLWDVTTEQLLAQRNLPGRSQELAFSPLGDLLALSENGIVRLLAVPSLAETTNFPSSHALFSPDGAKVIYV